MNESLSKSIRDLRFPLAAFIVFKHYYTPEISAENILGGGENVYYFLGDTIKSVITGIAVPLFFFISGYLYFIKTNISDGLAGIHYLDKTKRRIKSLLIPYLSWNLLVLLLFGVMQMMTSGDDVMSQDGYKALTDYTAIDVWKAFYALDSTGMPVDGPLWFIRDLFVVSLCSPVVFLIVRYLKWIGVAALALCPICSIRIPVAGFSMACWFYFTWGAYMALNKKDLFSSVSSKVSVCMNVGIMALMLLATASFFCDFHHDVIGYAFRIGSVYMAFGAMVVYHKRAYSERREAIIVFLSSASFFIFAIHKPIQVIIRRFGFKLLQPDTDFMCCAMTILVPTMTILIALTLFYVMKRYLPWLKFLNGYRL